MMVDFGGFRGRFALGFDGARTLDVTRFACNRHANNGRLLGELGVSKAAVKPVLIE